MNTKGLNKPENKVFRVPRLAVIGVLLLVVISSVGYLFYQNQARNAKATEAVTLGATSVIVGEVGSAVPIITFTGGTVDVSTPVTASLYLNGCTTPILGSISAGQGNQSIWTANGGSMTILPICALTGVQVNYLRTSIMSDTTIDTNFTLPSNTAQILDISVKNNSFNVNFRKGELSSGYYLRFYYSESDPNYNVENPEVIAGNRNYNGNSPFLINTSTVPSSLAKKMCVRVVNVGNTIEPQSGNCMDLPFIRELTVADISQGACETSTVIIGENIKCTFTLSGNGFLINPGVSAKVESTGSSYFDENCVIESNSVLVCNNIPTITGTTGTKQIFLTVGNGSPSALASITLEQSQIVNGSKVGRLYFVGQDNASPTWDVNAEFNTAWVQTQKYKDGPVKVVLDQLGNEAANGTCTFKLYKYGNAINSGNVLQTYTSAVANNKCEATIPVIHQTINYYRIRVEIAVPFSDYLLYNTETLVLPVGGSGTNGGDPGIEL